MERVSGPAAGTRRRSAATAPPARGDRRLASPPDRRRASWCRSERALSRDGAPLDFHAPGIMPCGVTQAGSRLPSGRMRMKPVLLGLLVALLAAAPAPAAERVAVYLTTKD